MHIFNFLVTFLLITTNAPLLRDLPDTFLWHNLWDSSSYRVKTTDYFIFLKLHCLRNIEMFSCINKQSQFLNTKLRQSLILTTKYQLGSLINFGQNDLHPEWGRCSILHIITTLFYWHYSSWNDVHFWPTRPWLNRWSLVFIMVFIRTNEYFHIKVPGESKIRSPSNTKSHIIFTHGVRCSSFFCDGRKDGRTDTMCENNV